LEPIIIIWGFVCLAFWGGGDLVNFSHFPINVFYASALVFVGWKIMKIKGEIGENYLSSCTKDHSIVHNGSHYALSLTPSKMEDEKLVLFWGEISLKLCLIGATMSSF